jgi:endonuclease IV
MGKIGMEGLRNFIRYGSYYKIPIILETPDAFIKEIQLIKKVNNGVDRWSKNRI